MKFTQSTIETLMYLFAVLIIAIGLILHYVNMPLYELYVKEDHFIEWLQFLFLLSTSLICFYSFYLCLVKRNNKLTTLMFLLSGFLFLFGAGEEISWGQRIMNIETPEYFVQNNAQEEINLHNLTIMGVKINKLVFGKILAVVVLLYLVILPILIAKIEWLRQVIQLYHVPTPKVMQSLFFVLMVGGIYALNPERKGELVEFVGTFIIFLIFLFPKYLALHRNANCFGSINNQDSEK